ncbi:hypothetical protein ASPVEDRAFT_356225 [Aspergillus versicolor CBS 583.65]|uniref:Uncharacterized protein n=1 Tax=Aspergillus versicolor CBS 583.65 TaxID=1036611 RepID=A0A1L9Q019_ASPVE|nr:uncharacterized protein ASPVEDRAFT_356225 [Aspergillus versicolor CBS 583.65]OJJ07085.1 hypothetical protein ASPVEDRAFT_356225 [Aspergillus versicolor CBS 583.65]
MHTWSQSLCTGLVVANVIFYQPVSHLARPRITFFIPLLPLVACLFLRGQAEGIASASPAVQSTLGTAGASCFKSTRSFLTERWKSK